MLRAFSTISHNGGPSRICPKVLVLGGTGFVGKTFIQAAIKKGFTIVSLSRRGKPDGLSETVNNDLDRIIWLKGDAVDRKVIDDVHKEFGPFDACVHAVGLLFDQHSGLKSLNVYASGSASLADDDATYDRITRTSAFNAIDAHVNQGKKHGKSHPLPFLFISAAEAGWTFKTHVDWLDRYLTAKRAVENKLLGLGDEGLLRPVIFRPSIIWTWNRPLQLLSVIPFYVGNIVGLPFVDRPVQVESLVDAMINTVENSLESGIKNYKEIDRIVGCM